MMRNRSALLWIGIVHCLVVVLRCEPVWAQEGPKPRNPTLFSRLFAQPTGLNGYEEWVQACDLIRGNPIANAATDPGVMLTQKRRAIADPQIQKALQLIRAGLNKPVFSPRQTLDDSTVFPEIAQFRQLARLLSAQIYVCFADGRVDAAIDALSDGLHFGYRVQTETLISGMVGLDAASIALKGFSAHLDMLSDYQCAHVQRLAEECLEWPSPAAALLKQDTQAELRSLDNRRGDLNGLQDLMDHYGSDEENRPQAVSNLLDYLTLHPQELDPAIEEAKGLVAAHFAVALANLKRPVKERLPLDRANVKSLGGRLFSLVAMNTRALLERYDRSNAMIRLLGVHAAVHRYRWEHNNLPNSLADLHITSLITDPFTGESLHYQRNGESYDLFSQGPQETTGAGAPTGKRLPIRL